MGSKHTGTHSIRSTRTADTSTHMQLSKSIDPPQSEAVFFTAGYSLETWSGELPVLCPAGLIVGGANNIACIFTLLISSPARQIGGHGGKQVMLRGACALVALYFLEPHT